MFLETPAVCNSSNGYIVKCSIPHHRYQISGGPCVEITSAETDDECKFNEKLKGDRRNLPHASSSAGYPGLLRGRPKQPATDVQGLER